MPLLVNAPVGALLLALADSGVGVNAGSAQLRSQALSALPLGFRARTLSLSALPLSFRTRMLSLGTLPLSFRTRTLSLSALPLGFRARMLSLSALLASQDEPPIAVAPAQPRLLTPLINAPPQHHTQANLLKPPLLRPPKLPLTQHIHPQRLRTCP